VFAHAAAEIGQPLWRLKMRPEDIPEDVWEKAKAIVYEQYFMEWEGIAAVAYAMLTAKAEERERCADEVERLAAPYTDKTMREVSNHTLRIAAAAIRGSHAPE
jgi:hypothetical protein